MNFLHGMLGDQPGKTVSHTFRNKSEANWPFLTNMTCFDSLSRIWPFCNFNSKGGYFDHWKISYNSKQFRNFTTLFIKLYTPLLRINIFAGLPQVEEECEPHLAAAPLHQEDLLQGTYPPSTPRHTHTWGHSFLNPSTSSISFYAESVLSWVSCHLCPFTPGLC